MRTPLHTGDRAGEGCSVLVAFSKTVIAAGPTDGDGWLDAVGDIARDRRMKAARGSACNFILSHYCHPMGVRRARLKTTEEQDSGAQAGIFNQLQSWYENHLLQHLTESTLGQ